MATQIIIPMWNKVEAVDALAHRAVSSVFAHVKSEFSLTVFDNASPVTGSWLQNYDVHLVRSSRNVGFGPAVNAAAQLADTKYVCQMNSDCELVEDSITLLTEWMERVDVAVAMPENYGACEVHKLRKDDRMMGPEWRFGAFWVMRREVFREVGGFDPIYKMCYWEDTDLWKRIEKAGHKIAGWRGTWVKHVGGASSLPERDALFIANKKIFNQRWNPA